MSGMGRARPPRPRMRRARTAAPKGQVTMFHTQILRSSSFHLTLILLTALLAAASIGSAQQTYVTRFDAFGGYNYLNSPSINLSEPGSGFQFGFRPRTWYSVGVDYTHSAGDLLLTPNLLPTDLQQRLGAQLGQLAAAGRLPAGYALSVNTH